MSARTIMRGLVRIVLHERIVFPILAFHEAVIRPHLRRVAGRYYLRKVADAAPSARIHGSVTISKPQNLHIGEHVRIGRGCYLLCGGGLTIGDNTQISRNVLIYTANHTLESDAVPYDDTYVYKPVTIGRSVWIGMGVCITPGVTIGDGAVIGMGTVVSKDVAPGAVVVGAPQRIVRYRDMKQFEKNQSEGKLFGRLWPDE